MNERARVCIVVNDLFRGGAQRIILDIVSRIDQTKFAVEVAYFNEIEEGTADDSLKAEMEAAGAEIAYVGGAGGGLQNFIRLIRHVGVKRPDVIQTFLPYASILGRVAGALYGVPVVSAQCNLPFTYPKNLRRMDAFTLPLTYAWTGTTNGIEVAYGRDSQYYSQTLWDEGRRHFTIYGGVDVDALKAEVAKSDRTVIRAELRISENAPLLLMVARLISWKGHSDLIRAMKHLPEVHVLFVGWGVLENELKALVQEEGVSSRVHFLGRRTDVYQLLGAVDCYVQAHQQERDGSVWMGPNLSQIEACAAGVPSVSTTVPLIEDLIEEGITGRLALLNSPEDLARAIQETLTEAERSLQFAQNAEKRVRERYSVGVMVEAYQGMYENIIGTSHAGR